jgi:release factor glutamine methyltransferase
LPYIPTHVLDGLAVKQFEPALALDGGEDGLRSIERLLEQSHNLILPGGLILLEIEASQEHTAGQLANRHFPQSRIQIIQDLSNRPRLVAIQS